jgi:hypothetical protein
MGYVPLARRRRALDHALVRAPPGPPAVLHPRLLEPGALAPLRDAFVARGGNLRIADVLAPELADAVQRALDALPFAPYLANDAHVRCFFWRCTVEIPEAPAPPLPEPLDRLALFLERDLPWLAQELSGRAIAGHVKPWICACRYTKGSYLDAHFDQGVEQAIAYVLGLTRTSWPAEQGGHLEFLERDRETVVERREPGWNTLDVFLVHPIERWHRVPLLLEHARRLTVSGWIHGPIGAPA